MIPKYAKTQTAVIIVEREQLFLFNQWESADNHNLK